jgi:dihydroneopterin aldolase
VSSKGPEGSESSEGVVELRALRVAGRLGVGDSERAAPQPLEIDVDFVVDVSEAVRTDQVGETVDYGAVVADIESVVTGSGFRLLESLAEAICGVILARGAVHEVTVTVRKLRPPVPADLRTAGVRLTRAQVKGRVQGKG